MFIPVTLDDNTHSIVNLDQVHSFDIDDGKVSVVMGLDEWFDIMETPGQIMDLLGDHMINRMSA